MSSSTHKKFQLNLNKYMCVYISIHQFYFFTILLLNHILALAYHRAVCSVTYVKEYSLQVHMKSKHTDQVFQNGDA